jgi:hypothetical protein
MPTGSFVPSGPFSRNTWRGIESLPGQLLNNLGRLGSYLGSPQAAQDYTNLLRGSIPGRVGSIPPSANGESYRRAELRLADAARPGGGGGGGGNAGYSTSTFVAPGAAQGGGFGGGGQYQGASSFAPIDPYAAQNREYERERARVEAMVKANPDMQKQAIADERAKVRDQGMAIWAAANPTLAKQVKPGQSGYEAIQGTLNAGSMGAPMEIAFDTSNVLGGKPMPQGLSYGTSTPTQIPGGTPIQGGGFPKDKAAMFERFMQGLAANTPTFQGSPLGNATPVGQLNYGGAVQPLGNAISDDFYKTDEARKLAALFAQSGGMR